MIDSQWNDSKLFYWNSYHDFLAQEFFDICRDKDVLEIAPMTGNQTMAIDACSPKSLILVEAYRDYQTILANKFPSATIISNDIFKVYQNKVPVDVVVSCGLLYHLHNSFQLLELIANQSDPAYIILDCVEPPSDLVITNEVTNVRGDRIVDNDWKCVKRNIIISFRHIDLALNDLGYKCVKNVNLSEFDISCKARSWMAMWEKI